MTAFAASPFCSASSSASIAPSPRTSPTIACFGRDLVEPRAQKTGDLLGALAEARRRQLVEHGERRRARDRVAAERAAEAAGMRRIHQLGASGDRRERKPAAERLAGDEQVGLDVVALDRPDGAGAPAAGLHLVVHVDDAVRVAERAQARG